MRALVLCWVAVLSGGCAQLAGLEDPQGDQCSPFDVTTCAITDTCDIWESEVRTCRPEGGLPEGATCDGSDGVSDSCAGALSCVDGACHAFCDGEHACAQGACLVQVSYSSTVCDSPCNVFDSTTCVDPSQICVPAWNWTQELISLCVPAEYFNGAPEGGACNSIEQCGPGLGCAFDQDGNGTCHGLCDAQGSPCNTGTCVEVGVLHGNLHLGVCTP